jgi:ArsR family transcriptional regulator, lead/cadmium/zinc/bismuth-responsive transcriptional repressor
MIVEKLNDPERVARAEERLHRPATIEGLAQLQRVFCEPGRLEIVRALATTPLSVSDLAAVIGRKVQATSQHLRVLRQLGVVENERRGRHVYYRLTEAIIVSQLEAVLNTVEHRVAEAS